LKIKEKKKLIVMSGKINLYGLFEIRFLSANRRIGMTRINAVEGEGLWRQSRHKPSTSHNTPKALSFRP